MTENAIPHEGQFLQALGVNPDNVMAESTKIEWKDGGPVLYFVAVHRLDPKFLAAALSAADPEQEQTDDEPTSEPAQEGEGGGSD